MKDIIQAMQWRYATKKYDDTKKVAEKDIETIMEAVRLAPSSFGLPVYKIILVKNEDLRKQLRESAWGQSQLTDASNIFIFAVKTDIGQKDIDAFVQLTAETRDMSVESLAGMKNGMSGILNMTAEQRTTWTTRQAYIGLGILLETSAMMEIDATPMEGFQPEKFDEILGLPEKNLKSVVMAAVGYRSSDDKYAEMKKVRQNKSDLFIEM